jgi:plastocyanin
MRIVTSLALAGAMAVSTALTGMPAALAAEYTVVLDKMAFGPLPAELHVGDTIVWQNDDIFRHSATARDKSFDVDLPSKAAVPMVLTTAGTFEFFCKFHPGMKGTLVISP